MSEYIVTHGIRVATLFVEEKFGKFTTIGPAFLMSIHKTRGRTAFQVCQCECGSIVCIRRDYIKNKGIKSCGCLKHASGKKSQKKNKTPYDYLYGTWARIRDRCRNTNHHAYAKYGGAGVSVCPEWDNLEDGYSKFAEYVGPRPGPEYSLDRYPDMNGNYEPGNVRWATRKQQNQNRRSCVMYTINGKTQCLMAWCEEYGRKYNTVKKRLDYGWTIEEALTTDKTCVVLEYKGRRQSMMAWSEETGIPYGKLYARYKRRWTTKKILEL
jgi:hypothetical protein